MKKVIIISSEFPPLPGGIGNHALHLALSLQKEGKEVTVITDQRSRTIEEDVIFDTTLPFKVLRTKRHQLVAITYLKRIVQTIRVVQSDKKTTTIYSGKFSLWIGAYMKVFFPNINAIAVLHGSEINAGGSISKLQTKWSLSKFDKLIAVSNFTKALALEKNAFLKIEVINNGFSIPKTEDKMSNLDVKGNPAIVTVGNVTLRKGQQNIINALVVLKKTFPEIHYHIVGIPTEKQKFETLAKSIGVFENITFHGALSSIDLKQVVTKSKVFCMLSDHLKNGDVEGFGIAVLEANFLGLPSIGSKSSGIADAIDEGFSGRLVNPHDSNEIRTALHDIIDNYNRYSENAKLWSEKFKWEIIVKKYMEIID